MFISNSKKVKKGDTFVSILGKKQNGNNFIPEAVKNGAKKIIVQKNNPLSESLVSLLKKNNIQYKYEKNTYLSFAKGIFEKYKSLVKKFTFIGATGTKGKTSITIFIFYFLKLLGYKTSIMSSAFHTIDNKNENSSPDLTTDTPENIYKFLEKSKKNGVSHIVLEVSSQAFAQYRIYGIEFDIFVFTNFSQEHGDLHKTQREYFLEKCKLYKYIKKDGVVFLNKDEKQVLESQKHMKHKAIIKTFSKKDIADIQCTTLKSNLEKTEATLLYKNNTYSFTSKFLFSYNILNIGLAIGVIDSISQLNKKKIYSLLKKINDIPPIPGRGNKYNIQNNITVYIDKTYTANSIASLLSEIRPITNHITTIFGCGGEKDKKRRSDIAQVIEKFSDQIYVTSDNPRNEPLFKIFLDIAKGLSLKNDTYFIHTRKDAIKKAIINAPANSIILLLGKGDMKYEEIQGEKIYFCEEEIIKEYMKK